MEGAPQPHTADTRRRKNMKPNSLLTSQMDGVLYLVSRCPLSGSDKLQHRCYDWYTWSIGILQNVHIGTTYDYITSPRNYLLYKRILIIMTVGGRGVQALRALGILDGEHTVIGMYSKGGMDKNPGCEEIEGCVDGRGNREHVGSCSPRCI